MTEFLQALAQGLLIGSTYGLLALGMGLFNPSISSLISQQADSDERGGVLGVSQSASSLSRIIGPAIAGPLFDAFGRNAPYYAGAVVMALVVLMTLRVPRGRAAGMGAAEGSPRAS